MKRFVFAPRLVPMLACAGFFGVCSAFFLHRAATNDRGLLINGIVELGPRGATAFYGAFAMLSVGFVLVGVAGVLVRLRGKRYIELDEQALYMPARWAGPTQRVLYVEITSLFSEEVAGQRMLHIAHNGGKITVAAVMLESERTLDEIAEELERHTRIRRAG